MGTRHPAFLPPHHLETTAASLFSPGEENGK